MISLILAGGVYAAATIQPTQWPDIENHTLKGEAIPSSQVVTRNRWGTPMLPDGKGGYSLIAPINQDWIQQSLIIPPWNIPTSIPTALVIYRPLPPEEPIVAPAPSVPAPSVPEPASSTPATPVEPAPTPALENTAAPVSLPDGDAPSETPASQ